MASTIEAQAFQFEMRPETSKCQRGTSNKFNKTLTGFHNNNNDSQGQQIQGYQNGVGYGDNAVSQKGMMNVTGFNFRQNKHQEQKNGETNAQQQKTPKQSILIQQNQQFSSTSQGFYQNKRQNSFSKGITLEQYFQNARDYEQAPQEEVLGEGTIPANQKNNEANTPSRSKFPQSFQLSDIKIIDDELKDKNFGRQKSDKLESQPANKRNSMSNFEKSNQDYSENMLEEQYDTDEFEIHEESDEEEEEDDEENKKRKKKKQMGQINNSSYKKQTRKVSDHKSNRVNAGSPSRSGDKKQKEERNEYQNEDFEDPPSDKDIEDQDEGDIKQDQKKVLRQKYSLKTDDQSKQQKENDVNSSNKSAQKLGSAENIKIPISNEDQIQKKIRDKYFKKTLHKPFVTQQIAQTNPNAKKGSFNTPNSHTMASTSLASTLQSSNATSNNNSLLFNNQQGNQNQSQIGAGASNIKANSPITQQGQQPQSNMNSINNYNNSNQQQTYNCIANMSSIHTKITATYQPSSTGHNFYSQNHNNGNGNMGSNGAAPSNNSNSPNTYLYAAANSTNRKANRSQSPLHTFKRQSNLGHSQQRRLSKEVVEPNSPVEDNQQMRTTFNNTTKKFKIQQPNNNNPNSILNNYDTVNGSSQFENHIAFRNSFYNKGPPLNSLPNSNYVSVANGQNNNNSKQRLTINDFYKNQSKYDCYEQPGRNVCGGFHGQNNGDYLADVMMMRRTAKENKFLNQKDKIQEMAKEDVNYITKHAARFNINPNESILCHHSKCNDIPFLPLLRHSEKLILRAFVLPMSACEKENI